MITLMKQLMTRTIGTSHWLKLNFFYVSLLLIATFCLLFDVAEGKGGATKGAAGGGFTSVTTNEGGNYTDDEMRVALIILSVIMCVFLAICSCQCYQKVVWELLEDGGKGTDIPENESMPMPCAPYNRDASTV